MSAADIDFDVEEVLLEKPEVFVYKIGAVRGRGHRANYRAWNVHPYC